MRRYVISLLPLALTLAGCSQPASPPGDIPTSVQELGMRFAFAPTDKVICAGQPTEEQFDALRKAGVTRMLHLRLPAENGTGWEEERAESAGISFTRLEIKGKDGLTRDNVDKFAKWLAEPTDGLTMVSCGSSNRVGALFALKAGWLDGKSPEEAIALGKSAGMTRLESVVAELLAEPK